MQRSKVSFKSGRGKNKGKKGEMMFVSDNGHGIENMNLGDTPIKDSTDTIKPDVKSFLAGREARVIASYKIDTELIKTLSMFAGQNFESKLESYAERETEQMTNEKKASQAAVSTILEEFYMHAIKHSEDKDEPKNQDESKNQDEEEEDSGKPPKKQPRPLLCPINRITSITGGSRYNVAQRQYVNLDKLKKGFNQGKFILCRSVSQSQKLGKFMHYRVSVQVTDLLQTKVATLETNIVIEDHIPIGNVFMIIDPEVKMQKDKITLNCNDTNMLINDLSSVFEQQKITQFNSLPFVRFIQANQPCEIKPADNTHESPAYQLTLISTYDWHELENKFLLFFDRDDSMICSNLLEVNQICDMTYQFIHSSKELNDLLEERFKTHPCSFIDLLVLKDEDDMKVENIFDHKLLPYNKKNDPKKYFELKEWIQSQTHREDANQNINFVEFIKQLDDIFHDEYEFICDEFALDFYVYGAQSFFLKYQIQELIRGIMIYHDDYGKQISRFLMTVLMDEKIFKEKPKDTDQRTLGSQIESNFEILGTSMNGAQRPQNQKINNAWFNAVDVHQPCFLKPADVVQQIKDCFSDPKRSKFEIEIALKALKYVLMLHAYITKEMPQIIKVQELADQWIAEKAIEKTFTYCRPHKDGSYKMVEGVCTMMGKEFRLHSFESITDLKALKMIGLIPSQKTAISLVMQNSIKQILLQDYELEKNEFFELLPGIQKKILNHGVKSTNQDKDKIVWVTFWCKLKDKTYISSSFDRAIGQTSIRAEDAFNIFGLEQLIASMENNEKAEFILLPEQLLFSKVCKPHEIKDSNEPLFFKVHIFNDLCEPQFDQDLLSQATQLKDDANMNFKQNNLSEADECYEMAIDLLNRVQYEDRDCRELFKIIFQNKALIANKNSMHFDAFKFASHAIEIDSKAAKAYYMRSQAMLHVANKKSLPDKFRFESYERAVKDIQEAIEIMPQEQAFTKLYESILASVDNYEYE